MAGTYCKVTIIGNLGRDPETRHLPSGDNVTSFSIAASERRRDGSEVTTWFSASAFGKLGETCQTYLCKGSSCYLEGALTAREYTDRDGKARTSLDVRIREMRLLDARGDATGDADPAAPGGTSETVGDDGDDVPF